jgi:hypothetical protein
VIGTREATPDDFEAVHAELLVRLDPGKKAELWRRIFTVPWRPDGTPIGWILEDDGRPVGFLGTLFAPRPPGDTGSPVCNLTSWIVLEPFRGHALRLLAPILARRDWTVTNLSPTPEVGKMFEALGFGVLERHHCLLPVGPSALLPLGAGREVRRVGAGGDAGVPEGTAWIVEGHGPLARFLRVGSGEEGGLVVFTPGRARGLPVARIHHVTDRGGLRAALPSVQRYFLRHHAAAIMEFDRRILGGGLPSLVRCRPLPTPRLFRSPDRTPDELTELFSERILLEL